MQRQQRRWGLLGMALILGVALTIRSSAAISTDDESLWFTIDSGGGSASGSGYTMDGTIGQPDAASASGDGYMLNGGFWSSQTSSMQVFLPLTAR